MKVDLKFPTKPVVSSGAKDLISQVSESLPLIGGSSAPPPPLFFFLVVVLIDVTNSSAPICADAGEGLVSAPAAAQAPRAPVDRPERRAVGHLQELIR